MQRRNALCPVIEPRLRRIRGLPMQNSIVIKIGDLKTKLQIPNKL